MRLFGRELTITKAVPSGAMVPSSPSGGWFGVIREGFTGAWQRNIEVESRENVLAFAAVYAAVTLIASDISKLRIKLTRKLPSGVWEEFDSSAFNPVLRKPNPYQTRVQFVEQWIISKLLNGNMYALKVRDGRDVVTGLYVLDSRRTHPLVADDGGVYYRLSRDNLSNVGDDTIVPASEIIHDRMNCFFHPLVGVSPIYACGASATQGIRIQANSAKFFENMSRPSGQLTAPGKISPETVDRLKQQFEQSFGGGNLGRLFVTGDGLKYEAMTIPAQDAQLIEQLRWTVEDVARAFHVPLHKLASGPNPTFNNIGALNQDYYTQTLQTLIEAAEALLDDGLALPAGYQTEFDLDGLLRMDPLSRAETAAKLVGAGVLAPNEARLKENLAPVDGGDSPMIQQQNFSLSAMAKRDAKPDPFAPAASPAPALPAPDASAPSKEAEAFATFMDTIQKAFEHA